MRYGEKLSLLMTERRLSQDDLVAELGGIVSKSTVRRWLEGASSPRLDEAMAVADCFCVSLESLAYDAYEKPLPAGELPTERVVLTSDERTIIDVYRDLHMDRAPVVEAMNAISSRRMLAAGEMISSTGDASYRDATRANSAGAAGNSSGMAAKPSGLPPFGERRRS